MARLGNSLVLLGASLIVGSVSTGAVAASKRTNAVATRDVSELIRLMDKDKNGVVSKQEFMDFMSERFDRADVSHSGGLGPQGVATVFQSLSVGRHPGGTGR